MDIGITGLYAALSFLAIPWAPFRWVALAALPVAGLVRSNRGSVGPNIYKALSGRLESRDLFALAPIGLVAACVYAATAAVETNVKLNVFANHDPKLLLDVVSAAAKGQVRFNA